MSNFTFSGKYSWTPIVSEHVGPFRCHFSKSRQQFLLNVYKQKPPAPLKGGFSHNGNISIIHSSTKKGFSSIWHYVYPYDIQYKTLGTNTHMYQTNILYPNTPLKCLEPFSWSVCTSTSMSIVNKRKPFVMSLRNVPKLLCTVTLLMFISTSIWWRILMITHDFTRGDGAGQLLGEIIAGTLTA